jgi:hypothetical protein
MHQTALFSLNYFHNRKQSVELISIVMLSNPSTDEGTE